jgi:hypothetical protein
MNRTKRSRYRLHVWVVGLALGISGVLVVPQMTPQGTPKASAATFKPQFSLRLGCLKRVSPKAIAQCYATQKIVKQTVKESAKGNSSCFSHLLENPGLIGSVYAFFTGSCVGHAGDPPNWKLQVYGTKRPVFPVMNARGGVYFRSSPHTNDTPRVPGFGVFPGEQVQLLCSRYGQAVGPYHDHLWYLAKNATRMRNQGQPNLGFLNAHYINDGKTADNVDAHVPPC